MHCCARSCTGSCGSWIAARASLAFAILALSIVCVVVGELMMMRAGTPREWSECLRWTHVPIFVLIASLLVFIRLNFEAGRPWLMWTIIVLRSVALVINFSVATNINFDRVDSLVRLPFLGKEVSVAGDTVTGRWQWVATLSILLILLYLADAARTLWRSGSGDAHRRAIAIGSAAFAATALAVIYSQILIWQVTNCRCWFRRHSCCCSVPWRWK